MSTAPPTARRFLSEEVIFPTELAGTKVELAIRLWAGLEGGGVPTPQTHQFKQAEIAILDEDCR